MNLNERIKGREDEYWEDLKWRSEYLSDGAEFKNVHTEVVFRNIEKRLIELIEEYKDGAIFGCVAWLTSENILNALAKCKNVQIIVQKEDFLRPDTNSGKGWTTKLRKLYNNLNNEFCQHNHKHLAENLSYCSPNWNTVFCVGNYNSDKKPAFPRAHHKFVVFCRTNEENDEYKLLRATPEKVWTGSFNFTQNAGNSLENVVILSGEDVSDFYYREFCNVLGMAEELDWTSEWSEPLFRVGT